MPPTDICIIPRFERFPGYLSLLLVKSRVSNASRDLKKGYTFDVNDVNM